MRPIAGGLCSICGERLVSPFAFAGEPVHSAGSGEARCGLCRRLGPPYLKASAYGSYDGGLRELIHLLKYAGVRPAANVLGRMLAEAIAELAPDFASAPVAVIPVPLYRSKLREREFNHAESITRAALKVIHLPGRLELCSSLLQRKRETVSQTGLTSQGYTTTRAGYLDTLNGIVASIWNALTSGMSTAGSIGALLKLLSFDGSNNVKAAPQTNVTVGGYASGQDPATLLMAAARSETRDVRVQDHLIAHLAVDLDYQCHLRSD